jgi:hypothetical protein
MKFPYPRKMKGLKKTNLILHGLDFGYPPERIYKKDSHYYVNLESHWVRIALKDYRKHNISKLERQPK